MGDNDAITITLRDTDGETLSGITWAEARARLDVYAKSLCRHSAEDALCAIFNGLTLDSGWRPLRPGEVGKAIENISAGSPLEINGDGEIRAAR